MALTQRLNNLPILSRGQNYKRKKDPGLFFEEIARDSGKYTFGVQETITNMLNGLIDTLIIYEDLEVYRVKLKDDTIKYVTKSELQNQKVILEECLFPEWLLEDSLYKKFVSSLEFISESSPQGSQFMKGFSGIGGILRY